MLAVFGPQGLALLPDAVSLSGHWGIVRVRFFLAEKEKPRQADV